MESYSEVEQSAQVDHITEIFNKYRCKPIPEWETPSHLATTDIYKDKLQKPVTITEDYHLTLNKDDCEMLEEWQMYKLPHMKEITINCYQWSEDKMKYLEAFIDSTFPDQVDKLKISEITPLHMDVIKRCLGKAVELVFIEKCKIKFPLVVDLIASCTSCTSLRVSSDGNYGTKDDLYDDLDESLELKITSLTFADFQNNNNWDQLSNPTIYLEKMLKVLAPALKKNLTSIIFDSCGLTKENVDATLLAVGLNNVTVEGTDTPEQVEYYRSYIDYYKYRF